MQILIELHYVNCDTRICRRGYFPVNARSFKEYEKKEAVRVALKWIEQVKKESMCWEGMEKVLYNRNDITELVINETPLE